MQPFLQGDEGGVFDQEAYAAGEDEFETGEGGSRTRPWLTPEQMAEVFGNLLEATGACVSRLLL